jgi:membrane AbrB-like protein
VARPIVPLTITAETLAIGFGGGVLFQFLGMPLPWLTGPAAIVAVVALSGVKVGLQRWFCEAAIVMLGVTLGSTVTPETLGLAMRWPLTIAGLFAAVFSIMTVGSIYLERVHGFDRLTARLSAVPGALNYVLALAVESKSDLRRVTITQVVRLTAILLLLPPLLHLFGADTSAGFSRPGGPPVHLGELAILLAAGAASAFAFAKLGAPAPSLFGAMLAAAILYGSGLLTSGLPFWLVMPGLLALGSMIGSNFYGTDFRLLLALLAASLGLVVVSSSVALVWALLLGWVSGLPMLQVWLAYTPGGVETTAIMALALGLDAAFVSGHHVVRVLMLGLLVPFWLRGDLARKSEENAKEAGSGDSGGGNGANGGS